MLRQYDEAKNKKVNHNYLLHPCTNEELSRFHEPDSQTTADKTKMIHEKNGLYCLDWKQINFDLFGSWRETGDYNAINVRLIPCVSQF